MVMLSYEHDIKDTFVRMEGEKVTPGDRAGYPFGYVATEGD
ncbi:MAG: hypothetical protein G01um101416_938 [Microgenomates group bacterium Gr01-1014_16]|nr:MAG: hypothetical protein G01um101416_938 [Microgenomates group bacterium Gr01-1014_16]